MSRHDGTLKGIRTVDLCRAVSGPAAISTLAYQGAEIIKMEGLAGNITLNGRSASPGFAPGFVSCNRGKCSIALDLKHSDSQAILWRLLESADIVAQNYRRGVIQRLGFRYAMVTATQSAYRISLSQRCRSEGALREQTHLRSDHPSAVWINLHPDRTYIPASKDGANSCRRQDNGDLRRQAVTAALFARTRTGKGQNVEVPMLDVMMSFI